MRPSSRDTLQFAALESLDNGKPYGDAVGIDLPVRPAVLLSYAPALPLTIVTRHHRSLHNGAACYQVLPLLRGMV